MQAFYPPDLDAFFAPIGKGIAEFASEQGLELEKYYHESASWHVGFGHPKGGQAKVELAAVGPDSLQISAVWWVDDYRSFTRSLLWGPKVTVDRERQAVVEALSRTYFEALRWEPGNWSQVADGYQPYWSGFSEREFQSFANPWPVPPVAK